MRLHKPASISKGAFAFCRYSITIVVWLALIFKIKWLIIMAFLILAASAIAGIKKAPMILLYDKTLGKIFASGHEVLDEDAMRFAHSLGTVLALACLLFLYFFNENIGWMLVLAFAIIKTISAFGFCPASKMYACAMNGGCCMIKK